MEQPSEVDLLKRRYSRLLYRWVADPPRTYADSLSLMRQIDSALYDLEQAKYRAAKPKEDLVPIK